MMEWTDRHCRYFLRLLSRHALLYTEMVTSAAIVHGDRARLLDFDAMGAIDLPQLTFDQVHRVRTKVTVEPAVGATVVRRQVSFFAECFGEVARVTSQNDEPEADFTTAAELRRLGQ